MPRRRQASSRSIRSSHSRSISRGFAQRPAGLQYAGARDALWKRLGLQRLHWTDDFLEAGAFQRLWAEQYCPIVRSGRNRKSALRGYCLHDRHQSLAAGHVPDRCVPRFVGACALVPAQGRYDQPIPGCAEFRLAAGNCGLRRRGGHDPNCPGEPACSDLCESHGHAGRL